MEKLLRVIKNHQGTLVAVVLVLVFAWIQSILTNGVMIKGNYGATNLMIRQILDMSVLVLLFAMIKLFVYKYLNVGGKDRGSWAWLGGGILSLIVTGCPACSITLASYLWLSSMIAWLPYDGLELKILAVLLMWYGVYDMWKNLDLCEMKKRKK